MMAIMRGPAGKKVCLLQLRHFSRAKEVSLLHNLQKELHNLKNKNTVLKYD